MKYKLLLFTFTVLFLASSKTLAQDAVYSQWENMPLNVNPALTGNFDGLVRLRAQYRNQWKSLLGKSSYKTSAVSAEYKFTSESLRQFSVGILGIQDRAGSLDFRTTGIHCSASVVQNLGNLEHKLHSLALGFNVGLVNKSIDWDKAQWPGWPPPPPPTDLNDKTNYPDVSAGLLWQYSTNNHFSFQLGSALQHLNKPNISFSDTSVAHLDHRFNLHGHVEIPVFHRFSFVPSVLYWSQGNPEQLMFGLNNRWYLNSQNPDFLQVGVFAKTAKNYNGTDINIYVLSATAEINSFLIGFSFDRFQEIESNAYEFSFGYTFGRD